MTELQQARILVTPTSFARNDSSLRAELEATVGEVVYNNTGHSLSSAEVVGIIAGFDGYIAGLDTIDRKVIDAADRLKVIARYGVGVDNIDLEAARAKGIIVTNTPGVNSASVAELTVGLILTLSRNITVAAQATRNGDWPRLMGISLVDKVVGLYGFGAIGKQVARRLSGFDCAIIASDSVPDASFAHKFGVQLVEADELIRRADFLSLHLPVSPETHGLVNADFLGCMKPGAYLVNTSRGELVDEEALLQALQAGKLSGAALDAFKYQPLDSENPLLASTKVIATPHMGAHTDEATNAMGRGALDACLTVLRNEKPNYRVV